jgi:hypothetical protein
MYNSAFLLGITFFRKRDVFFRLCSPPSHELTEVSHNSYFFSSSGQCHSSDVLIMAETLQTQKPTPGKEKAYHTDITCYPMSYVHQRGLATRKDRAY